MKIQKTLGAGVMSLGLIVGLSGFVGATPGTGTIRNTGPRSTNTLTSHVSHRVDVDNDNDVSVRNYNTQDAWTGNARVVDNTTGGSARSGAATNSTAFNAHLDVDNSGSVAAAVEPLSMGGGESGSASISDTGPHSNNQISSTMNTNVDVNNDNNISVHNSNTQTASSGNATVRDNTTGGDATSGSASNTNTSSLTLSIKN